MEETILILKKKKKMQATWMYDLRIPTMAIIGISEIKKDQMEEQQN